MFFTATLRQIYSCLKPSNKKVNYSFQKVSFWFAKDIKSVWQLLSSIALNKRKTAQMFERSLVKSDRLESRLLWISFDCNLLTFKFCVVRLADGENQTRMDIDNNTCWFVTSNCYLLLQANVIDYVNLTCLEDALIMNTQANITEGGLSTKPRRKTKNAIPHSN